MLRLISLYIVIVLCSNILAGDFIRNLPKRDLLNKLTTENFKNYDAVIILKEQSYLINDRTVEYRGLTLKGKTTQLTNIIIVKLLTEAAVKRYGSFEFQYKESFGNEIPNGFEVRVRVLKKDDTINVMDEDLVQNIVSRKNHIGEPLARKVLFKIPDLAIGDCLQIEYLYDRKFSRSYSGIFFYNDRDPILYSNLYITLPFKDTPNFFSFPNERIGEPKIQQISKELGSGKTYFWSVRNLNGIPDEPFSFPFSDQSLMTAFVTKAGHFDLHGNWDDLSESFYEDYLDEDDITKEQLSFLGFVENPESAQLNFNLVDSLYTALRKKITLMSFNSLYPLSDDVESVFDTQRGDASDLSYIMYKILENWQINGKIIWIRDKRDGIIEKSVPSKLWFDRMGLKVTIGDQSRIYDFDKAIPTQYEEPWFLEGIDVFVLNEESIEQETLPEHSGLEKNRIVENHFLKIDADNSCHDSLIVELSGFEAQNMRSYYYFDEKSDINKSLREKYSKYCFNSIDSIDINNYLDDSKIKLAINGTSMVGVDKIEDNYVVNLKNYFLNNLYDELFATSRITAITFNRPFSVKMEWSIQMPENYSITDKFLKDKKLFGPGSESEIKIDAENMLTRVSVEFTISKKDQPVTNFNNLLTFIQKTINIIEQNMVFSKI